MSEANINLVRRGIEAAQRRAEGVTVRAGKIVRTEVYASYEEALKAAGLEG